MTFAVMEQTMDFLYQLSNRTVLFGWGFFSHESVAHMCILIWLYDHEKPKTCVCDILYKQWFFCNYQHFDLTIFCEICVCIGVMCFVQHLWHYLAATANEPSSNCATCTRPAPYKD